MENIVKCYFSFRSPYSWLAMYRLGKIIDQLPVTFEYVPVFPPQGKKMDIESNPKKLKYVTEDIGRYARAYGLNIKFPQPFDVNWLIPHAAFLYALDHGNGPGFCNALYEARFSRGEDISDARILSCAAEKCGLDGDAIASAGTDRSLQRRILKGMAGLGESNVFGVPTFIYHDNQYWGNDRLEWLLRDIYQTSNIQVPDLHDDPMTRPC